MSIYLGPWRKSGMFFWRTVCFTGWHEWAFRGLAVLGGAVDGFIVGLIIGIAWSAVTVGATLELPPLAALAALLGAAATMIAAAVGAALGGLAGAILAWKAGCSPCGSCIEILCHQVGGLMLPVIPFVALPRTVDCSLIPAGCP